PFRGKTGQKSGDYFKGSDNAGDYMIIAKMGSWIPKSQAQRQNNLANTLAIGNGIVLMPGVPIEWRQLIVDEFDIPIKLSDFALDASLARRRIEQMQAKLQHAIQMAGQVMGMFQADVQPGMEPPPEQKRQALSEIAAELLNEMVPIIPLVDTHPVHIKFYQDWVKEDEG